MGGSFRFCGLFGIYLLVQLASAEISMCNHDSKSRQTH